MIYCKKVTIYHIFYNIRPFNLIGLNLTFGSGVAWYFSYLVEKKIRVADTLIASDPIVPT